IQGMKFQAQVEGTPAIVMDAEQKERPVTGPSPMQTALLAVMGCTASDVVWILNKQRVPFTKLEIEGDAERAKEDPKVFTKIHLHYKVYGEGIKESALQRAIDLSTEKYCSVGIMIRRGGVAWENTWEILPPE
ncbi:MAG TPA: osmotically inducible protein C, partial [Thermoplasmata archaeon]|nr:osmotically inducible protein C [Thermoplasmata archaeon]